jgi:hypothetical protein
LALIFFGFVSDDPLYPRHPGSIGPFFTAKTNRSMRDGQWKEAVIYAIR